MSEIDDRLRDLVLRRRNLPASIAVMETLSHAERINADLAALESNTMRLAACWDGELDPIGASTKMPSAGTTANADSRRLDRWVGLSSGPGSEHGRAGTVDRSRRPRARPRRIGTSLAGQSGFIGLSQPVTRARPQFVCDGMATIDVQTVGRDERFTRFTREWWPVPVFLSSALLTQQVLLSSRYDVGGHAAEHLGSASAPFMAAAVVAILLWATPRARRQVDVLVAVAAWFSTTVLVMLGNLRVIDDLVAAGYSHTPTGSVPDVADHALANSSVWYAVVAALMLVASFRWRRQIGNGATIGAAVTTVIFPPWIIPGAGVIVLAIVRCVARRRERTLPGFASCALAGGLDVDCVGDV